MVHVKLVLEEAGGPLRSNSDSGSETSPSDLNATPSANISSPKPPSETGREQAVGGSPAEEPTQPVPGEDLQLALRAPGADATISDRRSYTRAPTAGTAPAPPDLAMELVGDLKLLVEYTVLLTGDVLKGVVHVLAFTFVWLQKLMCVVESLRLAAFSPTINMLTGFSFTAQ